MSTLVAPVPPHSADRRRWAVLAVVLFAAIVDLLDATITNIAAPTIAADLRGGDALVQRLGASHSPAMGVLLAIGLAAVAAGVSVCCGLVWLMPREARSRRH